MNRIVTPVSYMGSGSSAITDLVSEFKGYEAKEGNFEYVFMHCPNGLFDLEDKLLVGNNTLRSDEALHSFYNTMSDLYDKKYWWVGHYKDIVSEDFLDITKNYVDSLIEFRPDFYWYQQEKTNTRMFFKLCLNRMVKLLTLNKVKLKKPLLYKELWFSYISDEEFYKKTKIYLNQIWDRMGINNNNIILDQLLLPQNLWRIDNYFDDNLRAIVVERDPRDVFIINKYVWPGQTMAVPYPVDAKQFCIQYNALRRLEKPTNSDKILRIHFEDLIYNYENTVKTVMKFLNLKEEDHINKLKNFKPEVSINNTQLYTVKEEYKEEIKVIEKELNKYLYDFPYANNVDLKNTF